MSRDPIPTWSPTILADAARWSMAQTTPGSWAAGIEAELLMRFLVAAVARAAGRPFTMLELMTVATQMLFPTFHAATMPRSIPADVSKELRALLGPDASRRSEPFGDWQRVVRRAFAHQLITATDDGIVAGPDVHEAPHEGLTARAVVAWAWLNHTRGAASTTQGSA